MKRIHWNRGDPIFRGTHMRQNQLHSLDGPTLDGSYSTNISRRQESKENVVKQMNAQISIFHSLNHRGVTFSAEPIGQIGGKWYAPTAPTDIGFTGPVPGSLLCILAVHRMLPVEFASCDLVRGEQGSGTNCLFCSFLHTTYPQCRIWVPVGSWDIPTLSQR